MVKELRTKKKRKLRDAVSCSAGLLCHIPATDNSPRSSMSYVNIHGTRKVSRNCGRKELHQVSAPPTPSLPGIYAEVNVEQPSASRLSMPAAPFNYATIDSERTQALQTAALERKMEKRRHITTD